MGEVFDTVTDYVANGSFKSLRDNVKSYTKENYAYMIRLQDASNNWKGPWLYTDKAGYSFLTKSKLHPNDIIMSNVGSVGKFFLIPELDKPMTLAPNAVLIKSSKNNTLFLYQMMISTPMQVAVGRKTTPGVQLKINKTDFKRIQTNLPSLNEQEQIGEFFKQLDSLIALHQRKLDHLKEQKKGLLQKMFPKNGEVVPEVRFPGFTDDWEQRKLGEVATFINGRAYKQNELLDSGKYKVLRVGNFYTNDSWYYSNLELADKYYIDEGDLVYTWSATFGPHIWNGEKVIYHYHIWKIELSKFLDRDFTLQILEADKAKLLANTNGSTMIHVTKKDMESKVISLPNIEEQKKIGSYLMEFDSLITLHQRKLEHLELMKKGLLQQMFV